MDNFNNGDNESNAGEEKKNREQRFSRPRSKTVMLTPEMTGQMRAKISGGTVDDGQTENPSAFNQPGASKSGSGSFKQPSGSFKRPVTSGFESRGSSFEGRNSSGSGFEVKNASPKFDPGNRHATTMVQQPIHRAWEGGGFQTSSQSEADQSANPPSFSSQRYDEAPSLQQQQYENPTARRKAPTLTNLQVNQPQQVQQQGDVVTESGDYVHWDKPSPIVGFLVSYDKNPNGDFFELRTGRLMITSEAAHGSLLFLNDETVSPMHAILRVSKNSPIQVLDQLSECGTKILHKENEQEEDLAGDKGVVNHGDKIIFGERKFIVCLIPE